MPHVFLGGRAKCIIAETILWELHRDRAGAVRDEQWLDVASSPRQRALAADGSTALPADANHVCEYLD